MHRITMQYYTIQVMGFYSTLSLSFYSVVCSGGEFQMFPLPRRPPLAGLFPYNVGHFAFTRRLMPTQGKCIYPDHG
jgi:hypothetical protein